MSLSDSSVGPPWTMERIVEASDTIDRQGRVGRPDTRTVTTDDYTFLRLPDRLRSPTMGLVQAWTEGRRPLASFVAEAEDLARSWANPRSGGGWPTAVSPGTSSSCLLGAPNCAPPTTYWRRTLRRSDPRQS